MHQDPVQCLRTWGSVHPHAVGNLYCPLAALLCAPCCSLFIQYQFMCTFYATITQFTTTSTDRHTHTHTHSRSAGTRKVKPIWILLKQKTVSGSDISWDICKSAPHSRQITMPAPHRSVFYRPDALPAAQPTASKHWRQNFYATISKIQSWENCW